MFIERLIPLLLLSAPVLAQSVSVPVRQAGGASLYRAEAVVEAVRQSEISPQVAGRIVVLNVHAGDRVQAGQVLVRIDAQAARQQTAAGEAQVDAARAQLALAKAQYARQEQLFKKQYISQAALEQAEAQYKATEASVRGTLAQAGAAATQTGFFTISAPYAGVIARVDAEQGDMAMPGKTLLTIYDPREMRVVASLPQSRAAALPPKPEVKIQLGNRELAAREVRVLPAADPVSHSLTVRLGLPAGTVDLVPGMFARAIFTLPGAATPTLMTPTRSVLRRSELTAVYVLDAQGAPRLRQVRLGLSQGDEVEVLSGLRAGERVVADAATVKPR